MITLDSIKKAKERIDEYVNSNNLIYAEKLSKLFNTHIYLKLENLQQTGSFKLRGAINTVFAMSAEERKNGVVAASSGNHAQGVALACKLAKTPCTIVMPKSAPKSKVMATQELGATVILANGISFDDALIEANEIVKQKHIPLIHAFDNENIMAGQGTIGLEIATALPDVDNVIVPVGGGGLIAGISLAVKSMLPKAKVYGVEAETINSLSEALNKHRLVEVPAKSTMADGINVRQVGKLPFEVIQKYVDKVVTVSEEEIAEALTTIVEKQKVIAEGAGAVGVAAVMSKKIKLSPDNKTVIVISGGNIDLSTLCKVLEHCLISEQKRIVLKVLVKDVPGELQKLLNCINVNIEDVEQTRQEENLKYNWQVVTVIFDVVNDHQHQEIIAKIKESNFEIIG